MPSSLLLSRRTLLGVLAFGAFAAILPPPGVADEFKLGNVTVERPWTRATNVRTGAAYMTLKISGGAGDRLVKAASADAERVEFHRMAMEDGVMRMREIDAIEVKPGGPTQLRPGGLHLMLVGLRRPLREGESIRLALTFEQAGTIEVDATVEKAGAPAPRKHRH